MVHCGKWSCSLDLLLDLLWASNFVTLDGHVVKLYLYSLYIYVNIYIECRGFCSQRLFHLLQFRCLDKEICSDFCAGSLPLIFWYATWWFSPTIFHGCSQLFVASVDYKIITTDFINVFNVVVSCPKKTDVWMHFCLFSPVVFGCINPPFEKLQGFFYFHQGRYHQGRYTRVFQGSQQGEGFSHQPVGNPRKRTWQLESHNFW